MECDFKPIGKCLICDKELEFDFDSYQNPVGAGVLSISFGWPSTLDQLNAKRRLKEERSPMDNILAADEAMTYICDDCFKKKYEYFQGFNIKKTVKIERV